jgi:hypothetical protein
MCVCVGCKRKNAEEFRFTCTVLIRWWVTICVVKIAAATCPGSSYRVEDFVDIIMASRLLSWHRVVMCVGTHATMVRKLQKCSHGVRQ